MFDFIDIKIIDVIDILVVSFLIYQLFKFIRGTSSFSIFLGILFLYILWLVVSALNMNLLSAILGQVLGVGVIALIVLFQPEIRRFLLHLGVTYMRNSTKGRLTKLIFNRGVGELPAEVIEEISQACRRMSETSTGALIVLSNLSPLEFVVETGDRVDANVNRRLITNIFFKNSPLHDGAMVVNRSKIIAVRCTLPINENINIPPHYGMRHKAAMSITLESDADAIVVSEETGNISFVTNGEIKLMSSISELKLAIESSYKK